MSSSSTAIFVQAMLPPKHSARAEANQQPAGGWRTKVFAQTARHKAAYALLYAFILLLYVRPQELFPELFDLLKLVKVTGILMLVVYAWSKFSSGEKLTIWPLEIRMALTIYLLGWLFVPSAGSPSSSIDELTDPFFKVITTFLLLANLTDTRERLLNLWKLVLWCGLFIAVSAIKSYLSGEFKMRGVRIAGAVGGIFGNPNDLATALDLLIPLAIVLGLLAQGFWRRIYYGLAFVLGVATLVTFSRGGFLGLLAIGGVMLWKLGRGRRMRAMLAGSLVLIVFLTVMPGGYGSRLLTILDSQSDETGSAQERRLIMERAMQVAVSHPLIGVGIGNFPIYSIHEKKAHNAYLEIAAELGIGGLLAYLLLVLAPLKRLRRVEKENIAQRDAAERERYLLSIGLQASFYAYLVCSFFASIQYLWFIYFPVAWAIALSRIQPLEREAETVANPLPRWRAANAVRKGKV